MKKLITLIFSVFALFTFSIAASASSKNDLTSSQAKELALSARQHYWDVMSGHILKVKNTQCPEQTFKYKETDYRYFCSELDTKKKLVKYLNEVFTLNAIEKGMKKYQFIEYNGKMAQPNADGGSMLEWENAEVKLIYQRKDIRLFEFTVPYGEPAEYDKRNVTFVKVRGKWQINAFDAVR